MIVIETDELVKKFGDFTAVDRLSLRVRKGELYGLLGPNGAGKTTAVKVLCGLLKATGGDVRVLGMTVPDRSILPRIGYMPQNLALYETLTVNENMALFGNIYGLSKAGIRQRQKELLEVVDLVDWGDSVVLELSGGMKHRASLACTLIHQPELLFLDEPTVGVDPELRASFWAYFGSMIARGVTVIITTHYMDEAARCDRVGLMRRGSLVAEGTPREIMSSSGTNSLEDAFLKIVRAGKKKDMSPKGPVRRVAGERAVRPGRKASGRGARVGGNTGVVR